MDAIRRHQAAWTWNWCRQSLVESAREFAALAELPDFAARRDALRDLEAKARDAAHRLADSLRQADLAGVHIHKPLQWFFRRRFGVSPVDAIGRLTLARVMQWRLMRRLSDAVEGEPGLPVALRTEAREVIARSASIVEALTCWLERLAEEDPGAGDATRRSLSFFRDIDRQVSEDLQPFDGALWRLPGLGSDPFQPAGA